MKALRYLDGTRPYGTVLRTTDLGPLSGTVLDSEIETTGGRIEFPEPLPDYALRPVRSVRVPPSRALREGDLVVLSRIQSSAQNLLVAIEDMKGEEGDLRAAGRALLSYQQVVIGILFGKGGFLARRILGNRLPRSGRAVLLPSSDPDPLTVLVPDRMLRRMRVRDGELVVVGRDPTIWHGGIEVLRARGVDGDVIRIHPLVYRQFGADNDGDQLWVMAVPREAREEATRKLGGFVRRNARWPVPFSSSGSKVDWPRVKPDFERRSRPDGFSVGPEDVLSGSEEMREAERVLGKDLAPECFRAALGHDVADWKERVLDVNRAQLRMKVGMGPVGAAALYLRILAGDDWRLRRSANMVAERLAQKLLDSKKAKARESGEYDDRDVLDLLNRRRDFRDLDEEKASLLLAGMLDLETRHVRLIVRAIWKEEGGLSRIIGERYPLFATTTGRGDDPGQALELARRIFARGTADRDGPVPLLVHAILEGRKHAAARDAQGSRPLRLLDDRPRDHEGGELIWNLAPAVEGRTGEHQPDAPAAQA